MPRSPGSGHIPHDQYTYSTVEIFKKMVVGETVGDKDIVEFGPLVPVDWR